MSDANVLFNVNASNVRLEHVLPRHAKAEDACRSVELQFKNARILPKSAAAALLAEEGGQEVEAAYFKGDPPTQRFFGLGESTAPAKFENRHKLALDDMKPIRVRLVDKIRLRFEGGPQRLIWADFSIFVDEYDGSNFDEFMAHAHEQLNRDVKVILTQSADLVDEMLAKARGMAVSDVTPPSGDLPLDQKGAEQLDQAREGLERQASAPKKTTRRIAKNKTAKKKAA